MFHTTFICCSHADYDVQIITTFFQNIGQVDLIFNSDQPVFVPVSIQKAFPVKCLHVILVTFLHFFIISSLNRNMT